MTHKLTPREPTPEMMDVYRAAFTSTERFDGEKVWAAMWDAAPAIEPQLLDDTSLRAQISSIGNEVHNLACDHQFNQRIVSRLSNIAGRLWGLAQKASPEPATEPPGMAEIERAQFPAYGRFSLQELADAVDVAASGSKGHTKPDSGHDSVPFINFNSLNRIVTHFAALAQPRVPEWRTIESAPKDGDYFVGCGWNYGKPHGELHYVIAAWDGEKFVERSEWNEASHLQFLEWWMPLSDPLPPAPEKQS